MWIAGHSSCIINEDISSRCEGCDKNRRTIEFDRSRLNFWPHLQTHPNRNSAPSLRLNNPSRWNANINVSVLQVEIAIVHVSNSRRHSLFARRALFSYSLDKRISFLSLCWNTWNDHPESMGERARRISRSWAILFTHKRERKRECCIEFCFNLILINAPIQVENPRCTTSERTPAFVVKAQEEFFLRLVISIVLAGSTNPIRRWLSSTMCKRREPSSTPGPPSDKKICGAQKRSGKKRTHHEDLKKKGAQKEIKTLTS